MKLLTLTGPSCSGKTTLLNELVANHGFEAITSHTTRPPRDGEIEGKDYYFVTDDAFEDLRKAGKLMESVEFNGFKYGVSASEVARVSLTGKSPVVIVEPNGLVQIINYAMSNGIELYKVYLDGNLQIMMKRYLMRSAKEDMSDELVAARNARRMTSMVYEHATWAMMSRKSFLDQSPVSLYDIKIDEYNDGNELAVIGLIKEMYGQG